LNNCRIGKVKFKSGGTIHVLPQKNRVFCNGAVEQLSNHINEETLAVGWFVVRKDRSNTTGWYGDYGTMTVDMLGGVEVLKKDIMGGRE
jgi:hypothetical protein